MGIAAGAAVPLQLSASLANLRWMTTHGESQGAQDAHFPPVFGNTQPAGFRAVATVASAATVGLVTGEVPVTFQTAQFASLA